MNTNKTTVRHKGKILDLTEMTRENLEDLRLQIRLDMIDITEQISWARYQQKNNHVEYDHVWAKGAIKAARIKEADIEKIDEVLKDMPYSLSKAERDVIELKRSVRKFLASRMFSTELQELITRLDREYMDV